ncbi:hypothetical protein WDU94_014501 [Cyamophila willieti]
MPEQREVSSIVAKIRHILKNHSTLSPEKTNFVNAWLERLLRTPKDEKERSNFLKYAKFLEYQLKYRKLSFPFHRPPPNDIFIAPLSDILQEQIELIELSNDNIQDTPNPNLCTKTNERKAFCEWGQTAWMKEHGSVSTEQCTHKDDCGGLLKLLYELPNHLPLIDFFVQIIPFTDDNGELIREISSSELNAFRELVFRIFTDRIQQVDKILSSRQCLIKLKYTAMEQQLLNRAKVAQNHLKQLLPGFNYNDYISDSNYIRNILMEVHKKDSNEPHCEQKFLSPDNAIKQQQFQLKFYKDEIKRLEEDNEDLMEEHNERMSQLNQTIKEQQEKSQANIERNKDLKDKLAGIKITADENQAIIDKYLMGNVRGEN